MAKGNFLENVANRWWGFRWFLNSRSVLALVVKIILLVLIPEAFVFIFGLIDFLSPGSPNWFIVLTFVLWLLLSSIALALIVWSIIRFIKSKKRR